MTPDKKKINLKALLTNRRYILFAAVMVVLTLTLMFGVIIPQFFSSIEIYQKSQLQAEKLKTLKSKALSIEQIADLQLADRSKVEKALPSSKPLLELITAMNTVAGQTQVRLSDIQLNPGKISTDSASAKGPVGTAKTGTIPTTATPAATKASAKPAAVKGGLSGVESLTVGLKVTGSLAQVNQFIEAIENVAPITDVTSIQLSTTTQRTSLLATTSAVLSEFQAQLKLSTYYFTQSLSATVEAPLPKVGAKEEALLSNLNQFIFPDYRSQQQLQGGGLQDLFGIDQEKK